MKHMRAGSVSLYATLRTTSITDQVGGLAHQVDDVHVSRLIAGGTVFGLCGATIIPAPMVVPEGRPCPVCAARIGYPTAC